MWGRRAQKAAPTVDRALKGLTSLETKSPRPIQRAHELSKTSIRRVPTEWNASLFSSTLLLPPPPPPRGFLYLRPPRGAAATVHTQRCRWSGLRFTRENIGALTYYRGPRASRSSGRRGKRGDTRRSGVGTSGRGSRGGSESDAEPGNIGEGAASHPEIDGTR